MHITLHLTNACNMACDYCFVDKQKTERMEQATACAAVDMAAAHTPPEQPVGIVFFGGEPLLEKTLIAMTVAHAQELARTTGRKFHFKITTNGLLLDPAFLRYIQDKPFMVALSLDGSREVHDLHRHDKKAAGTYARVWEAAGRLLEQKPYSPVMMTVNPDTLGQYAASVAHLFDMGFRYIFPTLNFLAHWTEADMEELQRQYKLLADFYFEKTMAEEKFYIGPFENKIASHIHSRSYMPQRCELGKKQVSVMPDGQVYPCVQFTDSRAYSIGNVWEGLDIAKRDGLFEKSEEEKESCKDCALRKRCHHNCGCMNKLATGRVDTVAPLQCAHERILIPIADKLGERLFKKRNALFIQKHYNDLYPVLSLIDDKISKKA